MMMRGVVEKEAEEEEDVCLTSPGHKEKKTFHTQKRH